jgi:hypothetical protein
MRAWRKIHSGIVASEKVARLSDSAKWLFTLLIVAQDDEAKYPWGATKIRALTVTTTWERVAAESLARELCDAGLAEMREGFIWVIGGTDKNGTPHNSAKHPMIYERLPEPYDESDASRERVASDSRAGESRVEKSRVEESRGGAPQQVSASPPLEDEVWPDWYATLYGIPGFTFSLKHCKEWLDNKGITEDRAEETAYALKSKWPGPKKNPYKDPWATFQGWIKRPPLVRDNGRNPDSRTRAEARSNPDDFRGPEW